MGSRGNKALLEEPGLFSYSFELPSLIFQGGFFFFQEI